MKLHCDWCGSCANCREVDEFVNRINQEAQQVKGSRIVYASPVYLPANKTMLIAFQLEYKKKNKFIGKVELPYASVSALHQKQLISIVENYIKQKVERLLF